MRSWHRLLWSLRIVLTWYSDFFTWNQTALAIAKLHQTILKMVWIFLSQRQTQFDYSNYFSHFIGCKLHINFDCWNQKKKTNWCFFFVVLFLFPYTTIACLTEMICGKVERHLDRFFSLVFLLNQSRKGLSDLTFSTTKKTIIIFIKVRELIS